MRETFWSYVAGFDTLFTYQYEKDKVPLLTNNVLGDGAGWNRVAKPKLDDRSAASGAKAKSDSGAAASAVKVKVEAAEEVIEINDEVEMKPEEKTVDKDTEQGPVTPKDSFSLTPLASDIMDMITEDVFHSDDDN